MVVEELVAAGELVAESLIPMPGSQGIFYVIMKSCKFPARTAVGIQTSARKESKQKHIFSEIAAGRDLIFESKKSNWLTGEVSLCWTNLVQE